MAEFKRVGKTRRSTRYSLVYPTLPSFKFRPQLLTLVQKQKHHDVLTAEYSLMPPKDSKLLTTGTPAKFTWKQGNVRMEWLGYVSHVSKKGGREGTKRVTKVTFVGSSYVLKQKKTKTYKDMTIPEVAAQIAKDNGFRFVGENHPRRFKQLIIAGQSQWDWLQEQASKIGYAMFVEATDLVFRPFDKLIDEESANAPLFQLWNQSIPVTYNAPDRTLDKLEVLTGDYLEDGSPARATKKIGGVNPITGERITESKSPSSTGQPVRSNLSDVLFDDYITTQVVHDRTAAKNVVEAEAHNARFNIPAKASGQGDPKVRPYQIISVEGANYEADGFWLVREATHVFASNRGYYLEMLLASDGTEENAKNPRRQSSSRRDKGDRRTVGRVNLDSILAQNKAFASGDVGVSISLATELGGKAKSTGVLPSTPSTAATSKLVVTRLDLVSIDNTGTANVVKQGFARTPSRWKTTVPSSRRINGKCGCCRNG